MPGFLLLKRRGLELMVETYLLYLGQMADEGGSEVEKVATK